MKTQMVVDYQDDENPTFVDLTDFENDMILESPQHAFFVPQRRVLGVMSVVAITYLFGCGGPIGSEPVVAAGGPLIGMSMLIIYPLLITMPYAFIVAELCSAFPEDGGFTVWVLNAFGPFWGFQVGYWAWISCIFNGASQPAMLLRIVKDYWNVDVKSGTTEYLVKVALAVVLSIPSLVGTRSVGRLSIAIMLVVGVSFLTFTVWAYVKGAEFDDLFEVRHEKMFYNATTKDVEFSGPVDIDWATLIHTLFWNFDGINMASVFGGEVQNPARTYPRAIAITVVLTVVTYLVPMPAAISTDYVHWMDFDRSSYPRIAEGVGGSFLKTMITFSALCTACGLYVSSMFMKTFQLSGMADNQLLPEVMARRNAMFDSPHVALIVTLVVTLTALGLDFEVLMPMCNVFACAVEVLIVATVISLRRTLPYIPRPTKVPGGICVLATLAILPTSILCYIIAHAFQDSTSTRVIIICLIPGLLCGAYQWNRHRASKL